MMAVPVPHDEMGEVVALVIESTDLGVGIEQLRSWAMGRIATRKLPRVLVLVRSRRQVTCTQACWCVCNRGSAVEVLA